MNEFDQPGTILYVDDEEMARKYFERMFGHDFQVRTAAGVDEAIEVLKHANGHHVDVVVTDFRMPGRDGGQLLAWVEQTMPHLVRILVTAFADKDLLMQTVNSGEVFRIIEKPLNRGEMTVALRKAVAVARRRSERRGRFIAIEETLAFLAHELNTPLASISNFARGVQRRTAKGEATQEEQLEIERVAVAMQDNARYCQKVLASFVDSVHQVGATGLEKPNPTASQLISSLLDTYPFAPAQRLMVAMTVEQDFRIATLPNCVALVLSSLLTNGLRALREAPAPSLRFVVKGGQRPTIHVVDNGPGIPEHVKDNLLRDPVTTHGDSGGSGWGMIFCKRVMESFGGAVRVQSELGKSTCVTLEFPLNHQQST